MGAIQTSDVLNLLQKSIQRKVEDNVPKTAPLLTVLKRNNGAAPMANNTFYVTEWVGNFSNIVQTAGQAQLEGGNATNVQLNVAAKQLYAHVKVEEFTCEAMAKVPDGSLINFVRGFTDRMELGVGREMNRTFHNNTVGQVARANGSGSSSTTLIVQALDQDTSDILGDAYIEAGDYIKVGSGSAVQVSSKSGTTLTLASAITWADEDAVKKASKDGATVVDMASLQSILVTSGTVQGVNIAGYRALQAYVDATSYSIATSGESPMQSAYLNTIAYKVSGELVGLCNVTVFNAWANKLTALKQTAKTDENIFGGANVQGKQFGNAMPYLIFMGGKVYLDIDCHTSRWYNLDPESMTIGDMGGGVKFSTSPDGKGVWSRITGYTPTYESTLRFYGNLIVKQPRANAKLTGMAA